jgi:phage shock protein A
MSDIVERLNEYAEGQWHPEDVSDLITDAADEIERLRNLVDQCDHHEHSLQEARAEIERLRTCVKTLTGQLQYIGDIATATAKDAKRWEGTE